MAEDFSRGAPVIDVSQQQPPRYEFTNPNTSGVKSAQRGPSRRQPRNVVTTPLITRDVNDIEEYRTWSIFNTIFCCWFLGCVACYFSYETEDSKDKGDLQRALDASEKARTFNIASTILGFIININIILYNAGAY